MPGPLAVAKPRALSRGARTTKHFSPRASILLTHCACARDKDCCVVGRGSRAKWRTIVRAPPYPTRGAVVGGNRMHAVLVAQHHLPVAGHERWTEHLWLAHVDHRVLFDSLTPIDPATCPGFRIEGDQRRRVELEQRGFAVCRLKQTRPALLRSGGLAAKQKQREKTGRRDHRAACAEQRADPSRAS